MLKATAERSRQARRVFMVAPYWCALLAFCLLSFTGPVSPTAFSQRQTPAQKTYASSSQHLSLSTGQMSAQTSSTATTNRTRPTVQEPKGTSDDDEIVKIETSEVMLPVTVRDANGRLVSELTRRDFRVWEDGREQPLSDLALRQVPVDVVLAVDTSSSVASNLDDFRRAVDEFAARLAPEDRISLIKFDDRVELLQDWTQSRVQLRRSLRRLAGGMFTRFNDALYLAAREQLKREGTNRRHAVVVLTDGIDSGRGNVTIQAALRALLQAQAAVYVISNTEIERSRKRTELDSLLTNGTATIGFDELRVGDLRQGLRILDMSEDNLAQLTSATGGRLYKPPSFAALDGVYRDVADELRHQYALYYTPKNKSKDGTFRRVQVKTTQPTLRATTRNGYFAPSS